MFVPFCPSILVRNVLLLNKCSAYYQLSLTALWNHRGKFGGKLHSFVKSVLQEVEWLTSSAGRFSPGEDIGYSFNTGLGGPHNRSGSFGEFIILFYQNSNPISSIPYPVVKHAASFLFLTWSAGSCFSTVSMQMQLSLDLE
jgi:hypothetical protein